jgi:hypothetical protein
MWKRILVSAGLFAAVPIVPGFPFNATVPASAQDAKTTSREGLAASGRVDQIDRFTARVV